MANLRLFIGVSLPASLEEQVEVVLEKVSRYPEIKWATRRQLHMTLRFIGDLDEGKVPPLEKPLSEASLSFEPFEMEIKGLDAFPKLNRPKVLFVPAVNGGEYFVSLSRLISRRLEVMGISGDGKKPHPHMTLGRVREGLSASNAVRALRESGLALGLGWKVDRFTLFQSQLTPEGAVYTRLKEFKLRG